MKTKHKVNYELELSDDELNILMSALSMNQYRDVKINVEKTDRVKNNKLLWLTEINYYTEVDE